MLLKKLLIFSFIVGILYFTINLSLDKKSISSNFSFKEIRKIEIGMNLEDVLKILGTPFEIKSHSATHNFSCKHPS
ncbi:hypothetical protein ACFLSU_03455 [Bacteroidota bacterium]